MSKKRDMKEDINLIERLIQDQLDTIEARLIEIGQSGETSEAMKKAIKTLRELQESCTLTKALVGHLKTNGNGHTAKAAH